MTCTCGHAEADHITTLFGPKCNGKAWHDGAGYSCDCPAFRPGEAKPEPQEIPW